MKFTKEKENNIIKLYKEGKSQKEIADLYNTYNTSIRRVLIRNNISIRTNSEVQSYVDKNLFQNLSSWEDYYWLGWLISDGCNFHNRITLQVKEEDGYILNHFKNYLGNRVIIKNILHKKTQTKAKRIDFKNKIVANTLIKYGVTPNKSLNFKSSISLNFPLLLGIFDGDGGFAKLKTGFRFYICSGSKKFSEQIFNFLKEENFSPTLIKDKRNLYYVNIYKKEKLKLLYNKFYLEAPFYLKRKKEKFGLVL